MSHMKYGVLIVSDKGPVYRGGEPAPKKAWLDGPNKIEFVEFDSEDEFLDWIRRNPNIPHRAISFHELVVEHRFKISNK